MMDFRTGWLGLVLLASLSAVQAPAQAQTSPNPPAVRVLTLQDCYTLALTRSETLAISREEIKIAEAQYWQAVSALFPQISFSLSERIQNSAGSSISGGGDSGGRRDRIEGRLSFTQTLFSGFREFNTAASLQALKRSQTEQLKRDRQLLYLDGATLFYQVLSQPPYRPSNAVRRNNLNATANSFIWMVLRSFTRFLARKTICGYWTRSWQIWKPCARNCRNV